VTTEVCSLLDRQQFHDPLGEAERRGISSAAWPLFGLVWPSALVLCAHLQDEVALPGDDGRVLEVGCGLALASLVLHRRRADVTASDRHPLAAAFLRDNLQRNGLDGLPYRDADWTLPHASLGRFALIVGSDVLYDRDQPAQLAGFIGRHAEASCEVILCDPDRGHRSRFSRAMRALGFSLSERRVATLPDGTAYKGRLLTYRRGDAVPDPDSGFDDVAACVAARACHRAVA
jgi:predicted nicotinamide N-methyase